MKKYMLTFFGGNMALRYNNLEKAEKDAQEKHKAAWGGWMSELVKANHLAPPAAPGSKTGLLYINY